MWKVREYARSHKPTDYERTAHAIARPLILNGGFDLFDDLDSPDVESRLMTRTQRVYEKLDAVKIQEVREVDDAESEEAQTTQAQDALSLDTALTTSDPHASIGSTSDSSASHIDLIGKELAKVIGGVFGTYTYFSVFASVVRIEEQFPNGWTRDDAFSRWYALGLICLTHCSMTSRWTDGLSIHGGMRVHDATLKALWEEWSLSDEMQAKVCQFMQSNIKDIKASLRTLDSRKAQDRWFTYYAWRMVRGVNARWSISNQDIRHPPLCDAFDEKFGDSLRILFKEATSAVFDVVDTYAHRIPASGNCKTTRKVLAEGSENLPHPSVAGQHADSDEYPSRERVKELWDAWEKNGETGLLKALKGGKPD